MIIWIIGLSTSGKSTVHKKVVEKLPKGQKQKKSSSSNNVVSFMVYGDIISMGSAPMRGTDGASFNQKDFIEFIDNEYSNWKHILVEGNIFANKNVFNHMTKYDFKVFYLDLPMYEIINRSKNRNQAWDKKRTDRRTQNEINKYEDLKNEFKSYFRVRQNLSMKNTEFIANEILDILIG